MNITAPEIEAGVSNRRSRMPGISSALAAFYAVCAVAVMAAFYVISLYDYPLFHALAELFSIIIGGAIFIIAWNSRKYLTIHYLLLIGIAFLFFSFLDTIHMLSYKGMGVFTGYDSNLPTQLWIAARYMESISLLIAPIFITRKLDVKITVPVYMAVTAAILFLIFSRRFPASFVEGEGLTSFKIVSEYIIALILLGSLYLLNRSRRSFDRVVFLLLAASIAVTIASELAFTSYAGVFDFANMLGHLLKIAAFFLFYLAIVRTALVSPFNLLFRELNQSNAELARAKRGLEDSNRELEAFCYSVSHDLRAPLRRIEGFSAIVLKDHGEKLGEAGREDLQQVQKASLHMNDLIDDMLMLSRVGRQEMARRQVDLSALATRITKTLRQTAPERRVDFVIEPGLVTEADEHLLSIVLENLLGNAWKFSSKHESARIEFGRAAGRNGPIYFVRDDGAGFDAKYTDKLFSPFQRLHAESEFPGTGIGLATVERIIGRHGGKIWVEAAENKGATFYFTLSSPPGPSAGAVAPERPCGC
ncbi:MAG: sensor histidine kinase [Thermoleophilia bacterium]